MKILLLDDDYITMEQVKSLSLLDESWKIVKDTDVSYNELDLVIVDMFNEKYKQILEEILKINPKIKTVTVSDKLKSNSLKGCEYCDCNYNRVRLIKPIKLKVLFDTIKNFDQIEECPLMDAFKNLENLMPIIIKQFKTLLYDEESQTVSSNSTIESKEHTMNLLGLLTLLDQNKIEYTLLEDSKVKIHI